MMHDPTRTGEVDWQPGLDEHPTGGVWVIALQGDGVLVQEGDIGYITGTAKGRPIVRWNNDHQCLYPLKHLARIDKPRLQGAYSLTISTSWRPAPIDGTDEGVCWSWIHGGAAVLYRVEGEPGVEYVED